MSPGASTYKYYSDAEWEAMWIEEHRRHMVHAGTANWLVCRTCSSVLHVTTQASLKRAFEDMATLSGERSLDLGQPKT